MVFHAEVSLFSTEHVETVTRPSPPTGAHIQTNGHPPVKAYSVQDADQITEMARAPTVLSFAHVSVE